MKRFQATGLLILAVCGMAQAQKPPKYVGQFVLFPMTVPADLADDSKLTIQLLARGMIVAEGTSRKLGPVSPALLDVSGREMEADFKDPKFWNSQNAALIAARWDARFVMGVQVLSMKSEEGPSTANPPAPGTMLNTTAVVRVWLYDAKKKEVLADKEAAATRSVARPGPSQAQAEGEMAAAIAQAANTVLKLAWDQFPKPKPGKGG